MIKPLDKNFRGIVTISGPTNSGKSELAEFLIKNQNSITYIATSKPRLNDPEWNQRIDLHRSRRPKTWRILECPKDLSQSLDIYGEKDAILIDSLGGLVEQYLDVSDEKWNLYQTQLMDCIGNDKFRLIFVLEELGWGLVPSTKLGHLFRERHTTLSSILCTKSSKKLLVVQGCVLDLSVIGSQLP